MNEEKQVYTVEVEDYTSGKKKTNSTQTHFVYKYFL